MYYLVTPLQNEMVKLRYCFFINARFRESKTLWTNDPQMSVHLLSFFPFFFVTAFFSTPILRRPVGPPIRKDNGEIG